MEASVLAASSLRRRMHFIGLLAGLIAGVLNAVVARVLMRVIALLAFGQGSFTVDGTAVIFMFGVLVGPLFGLIYRSTLRKCEHTIWSRDCYLASFLLSRSKCPVCLLLPSSWPS